ncbi:MAG: putative 2-hydroxyacid dehydrogenase [Smithella sp. PtaU1.Bin162]|nr:MAG: putative 2-hydroxyacid dehydrogenase [Smithella sp. PtaU1.Bin162]
MKILVTGNLPDNVIEPLKEKYSIEMNHENRPLDHQMLLAQIKDKQGLLSMLNDNISEEVLACAPHLKMIANFGVGYNNIDVRAATARGIMVSNTPGAVTNATAELAFALILAVSRRVVEGDRMVREGRFKYWAPMTFLGREVTGKTLGIVGMGKIGKALAVRGRAFDMRILYYNRKRVPPEEEKNLAAQYADLKTLLTEADFVSLNVPLTNETKYLIGKEELSLMKPTAFLINTARGPVVDEKALVEVLRSGKIAGAGLDVYENEPALAPGLAELEDVVLLPHVGSGTIETRVNIGKLAVDNLMAGLSGNIPPNLVNPEVLRHKRQA